MSSRARRSRDVAPPAVMAEFRAGLQTHFKAYEKALLAHLDKVEGAAAKRKGRRRRVKRPAR